MARILAAAGSMDYLLFSFLAYFVIERYGRRRVMMTSAAACCMCWTIIAISLGLSENGHGDPYKLGIVAVSFFFVFFASFAMGVLGVPWLYPTEVNALAFRAKGASLAMASNWIMNYMVAQITPPGIANLGYRFWIIWAVICFSFIPTTYLFYPETANRSLEGRDILLSAGMQADLVIQISIDSSTTTPRSSSTTIRLQRSCIGQPSTKKQTMRFRDVMRSRLMTRLTMCRMLRRRGS